jgi:hypothetical protein
LVGPGKNSKTGRAKTQLIRQLWLRGESHRDTSNAAIPDRNRNGAHQRKPMLVWSGNSADH